MANRLFGRVSRPLAHQYKKSSQVRDIQNLRNDVCSIGTDKHNAKRKSFDKCFSASVQNETNAFAKGVPGTLWYSNFTTVIQSAKVSMRL